MITRPLWEAMHTKQPHLEAVKVDFFNLLVTYSFLFRILSILHLYSTYHISPLTFYSGEIFLILFDELVEGRLLDVWNSIEKVNCSIMFDSI
jgi:hypothetical protein